jgi:hypothetical protein
MSLRKLLLILLFPAAGCSAIPDIAHEPQFHNPFPQLHRVAVLPFYNQSADPTVDQEKIALAYYNELQQIPGFEVVPVGVSSQVLAVMGEPRSAAEFQELARRMGVDAVVVGSVTEFTPYYPPRMGLSVRWYAANPGFHPIPPGYGLPWGKAGEEYIPDSFVFDAEFALAVEQLKTQSPDASCGAPAELPVALVDGEEETDSPAPIPEPEQPLPPALPPEVAPAELPADWPDPGGFIPPAPSPTRPVCLPQHEPVLRHTRLYHGNDADFTEQLAKYYYFRDDARSDNWQGYLQRSEDFIRFCCYLHITEMLAARGGAGKTRVVWRWPIGRYER